MKWKGILGRAGAFAALVLLACALAVTAAAQTIDLDRESTLTCLLGRAGKASRKWSFPSTAWRPLRRRGSMP